jgi:hypothetical protein
MDSNVNRINDHNSGGSHSFPPPWLQPELHLGPPATFEAAVVQHNEATTQYLRGLAPAWKAQYNSGSLLTQVQRVINDPVNDCRENTENHKFVQQVRKCFAELRCIFQSESYSEYSPSKDVKWLQDTYRAIRAGTHTLYNDNNPNPLLLANSSDFMVQFKFRSFTNTTFDELHNLKIPGFNWNRFNKD